MWGAEHRRLHQAAQQKIKGPYLDGWRLHDFDGNPVCLCVVPSDMGLSA